MTPDSTFAPTELRFPEAFDVLRRCSYTSWQPAELFPLWPAETAAWADRCPRPRRWGLHPPLSELRALAEAGTADEGGHNVDGAVEAASRAAIEYFLQVKLSPPLQRPTLVVRPRSCHSHCWMLVQFEICL